MTILLFSNDDVASLAGKFFDTMHHYTLMEIPFFILSSAFRGISLRGRLLLNKIISTQWQAFKSTQVMILRLWLIHWLDCWARRTWIPLSPSRWWCKA